MVKGPSGSSPFNRDVLFLSIADSLRHLSDPATKAAELTHTVIQRLMQDAHRATVEQSNIQEVVATVLDRFDQAAGTHYRAFHKH